MCDICHNFPCLPGCPNEPERPAVFECSECNHSIYDGEDYLEHMGEQICKDCVKEMWRTAEYDPY